MTETPTALLLVGVLFLILLFIGLFATIIVYLGRSRPSKPTPPPAERHSSPPETPPLAPILDPDDPEAASPAEMPARPGEVMRIVRDEQTGQALVEVEGQRYAHIREITDARVGRRVLWAIADLIRFTGGMAANPQAIRTVMGSEPPSIPKPAIEPVTAPPTAKPAARAPTGEHAAPPASAATTPGGSSSSPASRPPLATAEDLAANQRYSLVGYFRRGLQTVPSEPVPSPTAFIEEIEEILQGHIRDLPSPLSQDVHVLTGEDGVLRIVVGASAYSDPDEVPDQHIRQLIKAAVAEWETK